MSLNEKLANLSTQFEETAPESLKNPILSDRAEHAKTFDYTKTIQPGQSLPGFNLSDATGKFVSSSSLLAAGPLLIVFYRGSW